jgi:cell division protein FtsL
MAQTRNTSLSDRRNDYQYSTAVMAPLWDPQLDTPSKKKLSTRTRKNRDKARNMNFAYVCFLSAALITAAAILISYVQLQADLTNMLSDVAELKTQLHNLQMSNEEAYNRVENNIDLEQIKRVAIGQLGMTFPEEGQIVTYDNTGNDFFRRLDGGN